MKRRTSESVVSTFTFGVPPKKDNDDGSVGDESPSTTASLRGVFGQLNCRGSQSLSPLPEEMPTGTQNNVRSVSYIFTDKNGDRFVPNNCSFVFNPLDKEQQGAVEKKMKAIKKKANEMKVAFQITDFEGIVANPPTKIGNITVGYTTKVFPPSKTANWTKEIQKKTKAKNIKKAKKGIVSETIVLPD